GERLTSGRRRQILAILVPLLLVDGLTPCLVDGGAVRLEAGVGVGDGGEAVVGEDNGPGGLGDVFAEAGVDIGGGEGVAEGQPVGVGSLGGAVVRGELLTAAIAEGGQAGGDLGPEVGGLDEGLDGC